MGCSCLAARMVYQHRQCIHALVIFAETRRNQAFPPHIPLQNVIINDRSILLEGTLHVLHDIVAIAQTRLALHAAPGDLPAGLYWVAADWPGV